LNLLRAETSPEFEQGFEVLKSALRFAETGLRQVGSWAKHSNWDWNSFASLHQGLFEQADRGDGPRSGTRQSLIKVLERYAGFIGLRLDPTLGANRIPLEFGFASGEPPVWGAEMDIEMSEQSEPSSPSNGKSSSSPGTSVNQTVGAASSSTNTFASSASSTTGGPIGVPPPNAIIATTPASSSLPISHPTDAPKPDTSSPAQPVEVTPLRFLNFDDFLGEYIDVDFVAACEREIQRLNAKRGTLHPVEISEDMLQAFVASVHAFLAHTNSPWFEARNFTLQAMCWVQLVIDLRDVLMNERWVWDVLGCQFWTLRRELLKVYDAFEQHGMLPGHVSPVPTCSIFPPWTFQTVLPSDVSQNAVTASLPSAGKVSDINQSSGEVATTPAQDAVSVEVSTALQLFGNANSVESLLGAFQDGNTKSESAREKSTILKNLLEGVVVQDSDIIVLKTALSSIVDHQGQAWFDAQSLSSSLVQWRTSMSSLQKALKSSNNAVAVNTSPCLKNLKQLLEQALTVLPLPTRSENVAGQPLSNNGIGSGNAQPGSLVHPSGGLDGSQAASGSNNVQETVSVPNTDTASNNISSGSNTQKQQSQPFKPPPETPLAVSGKHSQATNQEIEDGQGAFHPSNLHRNSDIANIFAHSHFQTLLQNAKTGVEYTITTRSNSDTNDVKFLRRACDYFISSSKQAWFLWNKFMQNTDVVKFKADMARLRSYTLMTMAASDNNAEALALQKDIENALEVLAGRDIETVPINQRKMKEVKKRT
jgi:hypothetical protein